MKLLDTNVISYIFKEDNQYKLEDINCQFISSIVASEFLLIEKKKYYIPNMGHITKKIFLTNLLKLEHLPSKKSTDSILFDFGQLNESFIHFSNFAISDLINNQNIILYDKIMDFLDKKTRKGLKKKIRFLVDNNIKCEPILDEDINEGYKILEKFILKYSSKGNFRNTWNDILILSKSINKNLELITEDKLLNQLAKDLYGATIIYDNNFVNIKFNTNKKTIKSIIHKESKGYINNSWEYKMRTKGLTQF